MAKRPGGKWGKWGSGRGAGMPGSKVKGPFGWTQKRGFPGINYGGDPSRPPPGTYNPDLDAAERAANRGYTQLQQDTGLNVRRAGEDYTFGREGYERGLARGEGDYRTNTTALQRSFNILAGRQQENANASGVLRGGAMLQAAAKRKENQGIQQAGLNTGIQRLRDDTAIGKGRLLVDYGRQTTDLQTPLTRAFDENKFYGQDIAAQRYWQASQPGSGWTPPKPRKRR